MSPEFVVYLFALLWLMAFLGRLYEIERQLKRVADALEKSNNPGWLR